MVDPYWLLLDGKSRESGGLLTAGSLIIKCRRFTSQAEVELLRSCNVVHADISGSNCCVDGNQTVRLVDAWLRCQPLIHLTAW